MARRGRGAAAARPDTTPDGVDGAVNGADEPGARTIGALAVARWAARRTSDTPEGADQGAAAMTRGPYDEGDLDPEQTEIDKIDFGAVRIPVPRGGQVSVEPEEGRLQAVHVMLPTGRLSVSALAAPRTDRLWPDLAVEIDESLREGGATVRSFTGEWGRELHARTGDASSVFVGVDGPRWMLYGVATGPTSSAQELDAALRRMLRGTVVIRGHLPYPVRTVLPLTVPEHLADAPAGVDPVPAARSAEPPRRAAPDRPGAGPVGASAGPRNGVVPLRPVGGPPADPRRPVPVADAAETPTEPYGLPLVADHPARAGRPPVNGTSTNGTSINGRSTNGTSTAAPGRDVPAAGRPARPATGRPAAVPAAEGPAAAPPGDAGRWALSAEAGTPGGRNGAAVRGQNRDQPPPRAARSPTPATERDAGGTGQRRVADLVATAKRDDRNAAPAIGQRRVADLLADAERERRAAQEARASAPPAPYGAPEPEAPRNGMSGASPVAPRNGLSGPGTAAPRNGVSGPAAAPPAPRNGVSGPGAAPVAPRNGVPGAEAPPAAPVEARPAAAYPGPWPWPWPGPEPVGPARPAPSDTSLAPPYPSRPAEQAPNRPVDGPGTSLPGRSGGATGIAPQRLGAAPRNRDDGTRDDGTRDDGTWDDGTRGDGWSGHDVPADGLRWSGGTLGWTPDVGASAGVAPSDGSEDWTVPIPVVPPASAAQPEPSRDLWEGDPWAAEARRAAQAARAAEARNGRNGAPASSRPGERPDPARAQRPDHQRPDHQRPDHQRPDHQRPGHHRPAHERPGDGRHGNGADRHGVDRHGGDRHNVDRHSVDRHSVDRHGVDRPGVDRPGVDRPGVDRPGNDRYGADRYGADRHGADRPRYDRTGADRRGGSHGAGWPGVDTRRDEPAVDVPAARVPPPLPALAYLVDERTDPFDEMSGRHRRPER